MTQKMTVHSCITDAPHDTLPRAFYWQRVLEDGLANRGSEIAKLEGLYPSKVNVLETSTLSIRLETHTSQDQ